jgi:hypothetical protein
MTRPNSTRTRLLAPLVFLVALVLLFEEWCWDVGGRLAARIGAWPPLRALEQRVRALPPWAALVLFVLPGLLLLPIKVLALLAIAHGHAVSGIATLVVAKIGGAAVVARMYVLTLPTLLTLAWFARCHGWFMALKDRSIAYLRASRLYQHARSASQAMRRLLRRLLRRLRPGGAPGGGPLRRAWRALRRFVLLWRARRRKPTGSERL